MTISQLLGFQPKAPSTFSVLAALGIVAAAWECYTICDKERGNTFSATLSSLGETQPAIPLFCGALSRHLWRSPKTRAAFMAGYAVGENWPLIDGQALVEPDAK